MVSLNEVSESLTAYLDNEISLDKLDIVLRSYTENSEEYRKGKAEELYASMARMIFSRDQVKDFFYLMSARFKATMMIEAYHELIRSVIMNGSLSKETKSFIYWQLKTECFINSNIYTKESEELLDDLYEEIYQAYLREVEDMFVKIPKSERNKDFVIVFTSQILSIEHSPTKMLFDRCYILDKIMHKKVLIINTADTLTLNGAINWFSPAVPYYNEDLLNTDYIDYKGCKFAFYQCQNIMPYVPIIRELLNVVISEKPWCIISIGGSNITADLCAHIVPVLTLSTMSGKTLTRTTFQMMAQKVNDNDRAWLAKHGMDESHLINGLFTFRFKEQTSKYSRDELNIPNGKPVCLVVGTRLDMEINDEFMDVILKLAENGIYIAFLGEFTKYTDMIEQNDSLKNHVICLGLRDDVLAVYECCDIYINPKRSGGGTSAAGAMFKGLPAVTLDYGDVASATGIGFCVENYDEMVERVIRLVTDSDYYEMMSAAAKKRAALLTDGEKEFVRIIREMESRKEFW